VAVKYIGGIVDHDHCCLTLLKLKYVRIWSNVHERNI